MNVNEKIEFVRDFLQKQLSSNDQNLCKPDIVKISETLDKLIYEYYNSLNSNKTNTNMQ
ncbi:MAG: aspartyl-phosphate phosphatase Spo0E family protein [Clostridium sp.]|nr:aspartyl-phosphate phosphatase Spo0E family protein [Clostridium sp.]